MKKPKPRYTDRREILADIYATERKAKDIMVSAAALESLAKEQAKMATLEEYKNDAAILIEMADQNRIKSERLRTTATNLMEGWMHRLGEKMGEFMTETLPGIVEDNTVEAL